MQENLKAIVIGGGIHGLTSALALSKENIDVTIVEKNKGLLQGTSGSTQNRAHLGYHYPRSPETASECLNGLNFFKKKYPSAIYYPKEAYYLVEKNQSKTSSEEFEKFCGIQKIPYEKVPLSENLWKSSLIEMGFKVPEPVFDLKILTDLLAEETSKLGIKKVTDSRVMGLKKMQGNYKIITNKEDYYADIILNATYAHSNNVLNVLNLDEDLTRYILQKTEVVVVKSKRDLPALTVMDGNFISILPFPSEKGIYLIYDVIHSVIKKTEGYFLSDENHLPSNFKQMINHGEKYFPFMKDLKQVGSLYGSRPIPLDIEGDSRKTRIKSHKKHLGIYSILEGKFISAPLIAEELIIKMKKDGIIS